MIFLIDEVFRGTNSLDRVTGAKNVVLNLDRDWIVGMISTHDYELCKLGQKDGSRIINCHFTETYENNQIKFDYILRPGRSKTTNAKYLMKMVGIELLEQ
jgi:DNA mismatch repair ATPase MutS